MGVLKGVRVCVCARVAVSVYICTRALMKKREYDSMLLCVAGVLVYVCVYVCVYAWT